MEGKQDELFTGPTLQKIEDMMEYAYPVLQQFPKSEKFAMAADMKLVMDVMLEKAVEAQKKYFKKTTLQELDVANTKLQHYLRVAFRGLKILASQSAFRRYKRTAHAVRRPQGVGFFGKAPTRFRAFCNVRQFV